uniref:Uncharacterized protein n=1 Tax=Anopheles dirus TaxID=7168 RepID=A0A182NG14_9DIPT
MSYDTIPLTPPDVLIGETATETSDDLSFNFGDEDDDVNGVLFSSINPLIGGQGPLNDAIARPLTIQTNPSGLPAGRGQEPVRSGTTTNEFSMIVSPSLLTPTDMEIWRAIQQGQLDPKKIAAAPQAAASYYGAAGGHIPKSLSGTPTAQLLSADLLGDPTDASLLAAFDSDAASGAFRTIADDAGLHQGLLI